MFAYSRSLRKNLLALMGIRSADCSEVGFLKELS